MPYIDINRILNESPKKRLIIGNEKLKQNFTEEAALVYKDIYKDQPLSFIIENSRLIFSEPYFGTAFYENAILGDNEYCIFNEYGKEKEKVDEFIKENGENMSSEQLNIYTDLASKINQKISSNRNTIFLSKYATEKTENKDFEIKLADALYEFVNHDGDLDKVTSLMESIEDPTSFFVYAPYAGAITEDASIFGNGFNKFYKESYEEIHDEELKTIIETVCTLSKLTADKAYTEAVKKIPSKVNKDTVLALASESVSNIIKDLETEYVQESEIDSFYSSPVSAVNNLFENEFEYEFAKEENTEFKNQRLNLQKVLLESALKFVTYEYQTVNDTSEEIQGYNLFDENVSVEDAFKILNDKYTLVKESLGIIEEEAEEEKEDDEHYGVDQSKKAKAPKPKNLANKIQFKAMDAEAKQMKKMSTAKQKGQEIKNAVKAVSKLPENVIKDIKDQIHKSDEADSDRRKKYMVEPGFRKKAFRNLKLAMLYGAAAQIKLALVPVTAFCRHLSKEKDRRVRNELINELETEIKICEEKINDANSAGDNQEKYKLMRIKAKLEQEKLRVKTNSKYV